MRNTLAIIYRKLFGANLRLENLFTEYYQNNYWGGEKSKSGRGSEINQTREISLALPKLFTQYNISSIADIGCGDFNWFQYLDLKGVQYHGYDIVKPMIESNNKKFANEHIKFTKLDITKNSFERSDLVICRDVLVHLSFENIQKVINNIRLSNSRYFITTSFSSTTVNVDIRNGDWRPINLLKEPFNFPKPIMTLNEKCSENNGAYEDKSLYLWDLKNFK